MTDTQLFDLIQRHVLEPTDGGRSWPTGLWDREEVYAYATDTQLDFLRRTQRVRGWVQVPYAGGTEILPLPSGICLIVEASAHQAGRSYPCGLLSRYEADQGLSLWNLTATRPLIVIVEDTGTSQVQLAPTPAVNGELHLIVVPTPQPITGTGDPLTVGNCWVPFLASGVLARMFDAPGEANDGTRAARYRGLFELGVQLATVRPRA